MVRLKIASDTQERLERLAKKHDDLPLEILESLQNHLDRNLAWIDHSLLAKVARWNRTQSSPNNDFTLRALVRGSEVHLEPPVVKARSPELEAILEPIRIAQEQAAYAAMLSADRVASRPRDAHETTSNKWDFSTASHPVLSFKQEWEAVRRELSAVANILASMGAVAVSVWWAAGTTPLPQKTFLSLFGALAIAAIEAFLYIRFFQKKGQSASNAQRSIRPAQRKLPQILHTTQATKASTT